MNKNDTSGPTLIASAALVIAAVGFVLYPAIRPFSDEVSLEGAAAFGSDNWILAHMIAMVSFTLLLPGLLGLYRVLETSDAGRLGTWATMVTMTGVGFTLPFYGGEAYGLHAVGQEALRQSSAALLDLAATIRSGPGLMMFLIGLLLLAVGMIMIAFAIRKSGRLSPRSGFPLAVGMALYIPQFFGTQPIRVAHGLLVAAGCLWVAWTLWTARGPQPVRE
ncbi:MAG: hypothetical protein WBR18_03500 [Anaerolineales bacterium]